MEAENKPAEDKSGTLRDNLKRLGRQILDLLKEMQSDPPPSPEMVSLVLLGLVSGTQLLEHQALNAECKDATPEKDGLIRAQKAMIERLKFQLGPPGGENGERNAKRWLHALPTRKFGNIELYYVFEQCSVEYKDASVLAWRPLLEHARAKRAIDAIKLIRQVTHWGLADSKNYYEQLVLPQILAEEAARLVPPPAEPEAAKGEGPDEDKSEGDGDKYGWDGYTSPYEK